MPEISESQVKPPEVEDAPEKAPEPEAMKAAAEKFDKERERNLDPAKQRLVAMKNRILHNFRYHPPSGDQIARMNRFRELGKDMALYIADASPPSREQSLAMTHLEEAVMWFNAAIARNEAKSE